MQLKNDPMLYMEPQDFVQQNDVISFFVYFMSKLTAFSGTLVIFKILVLKIDKFH